MNVKLTEGVGDGYNEAVDIWAAGVILYILLCGFPPFRSDTGDVVEIMEKVETGDFDFPSPFNSEIGF